MRASHRVARYHLAFEASIPIDISILQGGVRPLSLFRVGHGLHDSWSLRPETEVFLALRTPRPLSFLSNFV